MKLTFSQLAPLVKGAAVISENADGSAFLRRFSQAQSAIYGHTYGEDNWESFICQTAAGMTLDLYTDSDILKIVLTGLKNNDRKFMTLDLLVDGKTINSQSCWLPPAEKNTVTNYGTHTLLFALPQGEKRVTLQLPNFCTVDGITAFLADGAAFRPHTHKGRVLCFGDSITQGYSAAYPARAYVAQLGRLLDMEVCNFGISGERFEEKKIVPGTYPPCDFVTVAYGTNDFGHEDASEELFGENMPAFFAKAAKEFAHVPVYVILPLWRADLDKVYNSVGSFESVRKRIADEAGKYPNFRVVDSWEFIPHKPGFFDDGFLHPNNKGMDRLAAALAEAICGAKR